SVKRVERTATARRLGAAARVRRAQEAIWAARPYAKGLADVIAEIAARAGADAHPLLEVRPLVRVEVIVVTSDRGQAGAFNSNIARAVEKYLVERTDDTLLSVVGRKGRDYLRRRKLGVQKEWIGVVAANALDVADEIANH